MTTKAKLYIASIWTCQPQKSQDCPCRQKPAVLWYYAQALPVLSTAAQSDL